ncbi:hypothetical protein M422DRAFT_54127 [Sphaerobolus stellatus SS14]|uniref:Uncharacterized protein n=1 Tax=Sphaerobolus stellatus (strain SS14) TaxID=990650 RepID=A0A0C9UWP7_SPHS4|nr:hypothetical protein M422DRAFT_54127 [Sphaerobolus stellatus SS14]
MVRMFLPLFKLQEISVYDFPSDEDTSRFPHDYGSKYTHSSSALKAIDLKGDSIFRWHDDEGWIQTLHPRISRGFYLGEEDIQEAESILQRYIELILEDEDYGSSSTPVSTVRKVFKWLPIPRVFKRQM